MNSLLSLSRSSGPWVHQGPVNKEATATSVGERYTGSNAEYLVTSTDFQGAISRQAFTTTAVPILQQRFPFSVVAHPGDDDTPLCFDEPAILGAQLGTHGLSLVPIPKTLYDLFAVLYVLENKTSPKVASEGYDVHLSTDHIVPEHDILTSAQHALQRGENNENYQLLSWNVNTYAIDIFRKENIDIASLTQRDVLFVAKALFRRGAVATNAFRALIPDNLGWEGAYPKTPDAALLERYARIFSEAHHRGWPTGYFPSAKGRHLLLTAIEHEMRAPLGTFSIFRSGRHTLDSTASSQVPSGLAWLSFGSSALMGFIHDGDHGSPLGSSYLDAQKDFIAFDLPKHDWLHNKGGIRDHLYLPGLRGLHRVFSVGEFYHPRLLPVALVAKSLFAFAEPETASLGLAFHELSRALRISEDYLKKSAHHSFSHTQADAFFAPLFVPVENGFFFQNENRRRQGIRQSRAIFWAHTKVLVPESLTFADEVASHKN